jgi:hypothetical protein
MTVESIDAARSYPPRRPRRRLLSRIRPALRKLRWTLALGLIRTAFRVAKAGGRPYQPVEIKGKRYDNLRDSDTRWQAIAQVLREHEVRNVLDVGCAEGWFARRAATELRCFTLGIEAGDATIVGELARLHDRAERIAVMRAFMTPEAIRTLPKFDAVLCLSVLHHVIRGFGLASAEQFLKALASRVEKVFLFEIGTADESSWTEALPSFEGGQEAFVRSLLERSGFRNVRVIGETAAFHREAPRLLFAAEPASAQAKEVLRHLESA